MKRSKKAATKSNPKAKKAAKNVRAKTKVKPKSNKTKGASRGAVSLETLFAEIEKISSRLDHLEKDVRNLQGIAYPIG
jgi:predicted transcriptional regulator